MNYSELLKDFSELVKKEGYAIATSFLVLLLIGVIFPTVWVFLFSIMLSFVASDVILNFFIHGGKKWTKIFTDKYFANKGYAYLAFLIGIVVGTILSSMFADLVLRYAQSNFTWFVTVFVTDALVVLVVAADLEWRFYKL